MDISFSYINNKGQLFNYLNLIASSDTASNSFYYTVDIIIMLVRNLVESLT